VSVPGIVSLKQLAKNITGKAEDASLLGNVGVITPGKEVDIKKLLVELEKRLRENVVQAALANKHARFSRSTGPVCNEAAVNRIFDSTNRSAYIPGFDCIRMAQVVMARGVIMTLMPDEFDKLGLTPYSFCPDTGAAAPFFKHYPIDPFIPLAGLAPGDYAYFDNNKNYPKVHDGPWAGEAVIKTGGDSYFGWAKGSWPYAWWIWTLWHKYNDGLTLSKQISIDKVPGYQGSAGFVDVAKLAMAIFNMRKTEV
jgi:hypothetical protein